MASGRWAAAIGASETQSAEDSPQATVTYRIPVARWEDALDLLRGLTGKRRKVVAENTNAVEVTGAVVDLEARIKNLRASEAALQEISSRATCISDVLEVEAQLTNVRGQIEQLTAQADPAQRPGVVRDHDGELQRPSRGGSRRHRELEPAKVVDEATASLVDTLQALTTAGIWFAIVCCQSRCCWVASPSRCSSCADSAIRIGRSPGDAPAAAREGAPTRWPDDAPARRLGHGTMGP